jgi:signal transduction histidine kinase
MTKKPIIHTFMAEKILVVDDTPDNLRLLSQLLINKGYEVRLAPNGELALSSIKHFLPDLILLDILMPGMDGYEVCSQLKRQKITRDIPVIFLSALGETFDKVKAFEVGGADYIGKPFQVEEVLIRIKHQITIKKLQDKLNKQNQNLKKEVKKRKIAEFEAKSALKVKSDFLANMSHELRTPLNAILGFAEIMLRTPGIPEKDYNYLEIIRNSGKHLLSLINDILDLSKIESGQMTLNEVKFDLWSLLQDVKNIFSLKADHKNLEWLLEYNESLPQYICADQIKIRQVLINLVSNSIKFTEQGKVILKVEYQQKESEHFLTFSVEDTGLGIAPEEIDKLFIPFEQTATGRNSFEGTGLGLAISQNFVKLMKGEITVTSVVNQGSCFSFTIPITLAPVCKIKPSTQPKITTLAPNQPSYRILVVDDSRLNRLLLVKLLQNVGFEVQEAENGAECLKLWSSWQPHLIFLDLRMPVLNGMEAAQQIRSQETNNQPTILIALTASVLEDSRPAVLGVGFNDFIPKPFEPELLYAKIQQYLPVEYIYS